MIHFTAPLELWNSTDGSWHFMTVPEEFVGEIKAHAFEMPRGFRSVRVEVSIADPSAGSGQAITWRTSIFPMKTGSYFLPIKAEARRKAGIAAGDDVNVTLDLL